MNTSVHHTRRGAGTAFGAILALTLAAASLSPLGAQSGALERDSTLNNLSHEAGYRASRLGELGAVVSVGRGPIDLVIIPGWGFGADAFTGFMQAHKSDFRMLAVTLPGFGGTAAPPMPVAGTSYSEATWTKAAEVAIADLIRKRRLRKPILVGHFIVGAQLALRLAVDYPDLVGGVVTIGAEPMRLLPSRTDSTGRVRVTTMPRSQLIDQFAQSWYRVVTRRTWDTNNYAWPQYSTDSATARRWWQASASVPMPVMIRYLCEYMADDAMPRYRAVRVPMLSLAPTFSPEVLSDPKQSYVRGLFGDAWRAVQDSVPGARVEYPPDSRIMMHLDRPELLVDAIRRVAQAPRAR